MTAFEPSFNSLEPLLFNQYEDVVYEPESGLSPGDLETEVQQFLTENTGLPRVLVRAEVFSIIAKKARISMQPYEWFPFKLEHRGLLRGLARQWMKEEEEGVTNGQRYDLITYLRFLVLEDNRRPAVVCLGFAWPACKPHQDKGLAPLVGSHWGAGFRTAVMGHVHLTCDFLRREWGGRADYHDHFAATHLNR